MNALSRLYGFVVVLSSLLITIFALDIITSVVLPEPWIWLRNGEQPLDISIIEKVGNRLSGISISKSLEKKQDYKIIALLGQSNLEVGIDSKRLTENTNGNYRFVSLSTYGGSFDRLLEANELIQLSDLNPEIVILAVSPSFLSGRPFLQDRDLKLNPSPNLYRELERSKDFAPKGITYFQLNRLIFSHYMRISAHHMRLSLAKAFKFSIQDLYRPAADSWYQKYPGDWAGKKMDDETILGNFEYWEKLGHFNADNYKRDSGNAKAFCKIIKSWLDRNTKVLVVFLPEHSMIRDKMPPNAISILQDISSTYFSEKVQIIDLRDCIPDSMFQDMYHLMPDGLEKTTNILSQKLKPFLFTNK